jgi:hypothetical protein
MVQALVELDENTNRVLNIVKAKFGLKDKSEAIKTITRYYVENEDEPELRPQFIEKIKKAEKGKFIKVSNFSKHFGVE